MTDQLFLSVWLDRAGRNNRLKQFEKLLRLFPFSQRPQPQSVVSVLAVSTAEPPLLEKPLNFPVDLEELLKPFKEFSGEDIAYSVEGWWDLWRYQDHNNDWALTPSRILLSCFGPQFDNGTSAENTEQEDLRIDFGIDTWYLPNVDIPGAPKLIESNIKSLLRVVHEIDSALAVSRRALQTELGMNFAERLQAVMRRAEEQ